MLPQMKGGWTGVREQSRETSEKQLIFTDYIASKQSSFSLTISRSLAVIIQVWITTLITTLSCQNSL